MKMTLLLRLSAAVFLLASVALNVHFLTAGKSPRNRRRNHAGAEPESCRKREQKGLRCVNSKTSLETQFLRCL